MCGRARLSTDFSEIKIIFGIPPGQPVPNFAPTYNLAPTDPIPIVRHSFRIENRDLAVARWRLIPYWAKDIKIGYSTFNARCEDVEAKPVFREAFKRRRCLVPLDNFYECVAELHDRMPVILPPEAWSVWLGEEPADTDRLKALPAPYPADGLTMWPVDKRVGNVKNNDPSLIGPMAVA
jgi:putative SOS response-associated peptidase YedK